MNSLDEKMKWLKVLEEQDCKSMIKQSSQSATCLPGNWTGIGGPLTPWSAGSPLFIGQHIGQHIGQQYPGQTFPDKQKQADAEAQINSWIRRQSATEGKAALDRRAADLAAACEQAQGALGARHHLRIALSEGNEQAWLRCWGVAMERGFGAECLVHGKSETLAAAALGPSPFKALEWLMGAGFDPGVALSSQILLASLASGSSGAAAKALVELFNAGSLNTAVRSTLDILKKGLGAQAFANAESFELMGLSGKGKTKKNSSRL